MISQMAQFRLADTAGMPRGRAILLARVLKEGGAWPRRDEALSALHLANFVTGCVSPAAHNGMEAVKIASSIRSEGLMQMTLSDEVEGPAIDVIDANKFAELFGLPREKGLSFTDFLTIIITFVGNLPQDLRDRVSQLVEDKMMFQIEICLSPPSAQIYWNEYEGVPIPGTFTALNRCRFRFLPEKTAAESFSRFVTFTRIPFGILVAAGEIYAEAQLRVRNRSSIAGGGRASATPETTTAAAPGSATAAKRSPSPGSDELVKDRAPRKKTPRGRQQPPKATSSTPIRQHPNRSLIHEAAPEPCSPN